MNDGQATCYFFNLTKGTYVSYNRNGESSTWGPSSVRPIEADWPNLPLRLKPDPSKKAVPCLQIVYGKDSLLYAFYGYSVADNWSWDNRKYVEYDYVKKSSTVHNVKELAPGDGETTELLSYVTTAVNMSEGSTPQKAVLVYQQASTQQSTHNPQTAFILEEQVWYFKAKANCSEVNSGLSYLPIACDLAKAIPGMSGKPVQLKTGLNIGNQTLWFFSDEYCMTATAWAMSYPTPNMSTIQPIQKAWPGLLDVWPSWSTDVITATRLGGDRAAKP